MRQMITVAEAKNIISQNCFVLRPVVVQLGDAAGCILATDVISTVDIPNFRQSSMDGYAINYEGYRQHQTLAIMGEMAAGAEKELSILPHQAARIFTGAPIPHGADTVVMQEKTSVSGATLSITDESIQKAASTRAIGAEITAGTIALKKGTLLTAGALGYIAGLGIASVSIYPAPSVAIILTGNELQLPGEALLYGQVYEANSFSLSAALRVAGVSCITVLKSRDDLDELTITLSQALETADLVLLTGGVSVGDYDFVIPATENCGIEKLFHKIRQKPGKPLFFGKKDNKIIFGLPGNPSSVLTCFYQYVLRAIELVKCSGPLINEFTAPLAGSVNKLPGLTHFLKGNFDGHSVEALPAQESFRMSSFATANCLLEIEENIVEGKDGDLVTVYLLPT